MKTVARHHPGPAIRRARREIEMFQNELAECIGRSPAYVCNFEMGRIDATRAEVAAMRAAIKAHRRAQRGARS